VKKLTSLILAALMILSLSFVSCGDNSDEKTVVTTAAESEISETEIITEINLKDTILKKDFGGAEYKILAAAEQWKSKVTAEEENGEILNDAIFYRDRNIEEDYGVNLEYEVVNGYYAGKDNVRKKLHGSIMAGDAVYDLFTGNTAYLCERILEGFFMNQSDLDPLDFERPWYYNNVNKNITAYGKLFVSSGGFNFSNESESWCTIFNKELLDSLGLESPYDKVYDGSWIFDELTRMGAVASSDLNGDGEFTKEDRFGVLITGTAPSYSLPYGFGRLITVLDEDGIPRLTGADERNIEIFNKLYDFFSDKTLYYSCLSEPGEELISKFSAGQGLFVLYPLYLVEIPEMRESVDFGILPLPKYDEQQDTYYSLCWAAVAAIPLVVKDVEKSAVILEALNCYSYVDVIPQYTEIVLQRKLSRDDESAGTVKLLSEGISMDFGTLFNASLDPVLVFAEKICLSGNYSSWWAKNEIKIETNLAKILEAISQLN
jgi:ABC-type glycerol-3-phosphate transport system substrate-binding protein